MTHRGPFQPLPFCDSVRKAAWKTVHSRDSSSSDLFAATEGAGDSFLMVTSKLAPIPFEDGSRDRN